MIKDIAQFFRKSRASRIAVAVIVGSVAIAGAVYLYFHDPYSHPLPCLFYLMTGFYCPGCGSGRASYSLLHGRFLDAFCYNPLMTILLPLIGIYIVARGIDWVITGGDHIDQYINVKVVIVILIIVLIFGVIRNIPVFPFNLLVPGGLAEIFHS